MFFKIGVLKNLQFYQKETPTQVFSCEICDIFKETFFHGTSSAFLKQKSKNEKKNSHKYIHRKTPVIVSFLVLLQTSGLTVLQKRDSILDIFCEICEVLQNLNFAEDR